jgi:integrase
LNSTKITSRKVHQQTEDSFNVWIERYEQLAIAGVRSEAVARKIGLHLRRFQAFFLLAYGHQRVSACLRRDVLAWQASLKEQKLAPATINNHVASFSAFTTWLHAQVPTLFPMGDPAKGISELILPPLEPRTLSEAQIRSLKNLCDRLPRFHQAKGRNWQGKGEIPMRAHGRPWRDRAIVFVLLSTGLRREELTKLNLEQIQPNTATLLKQSRTARIVRVEGKGKMERTVFLSADARDALADYLEKERGQDITSETKALFLSAMCLSARRDDGRLSPRAINLILEQIGRWHDAEVNSSERCISPLRPHDLRHTFAFQLAKITGADAYELERRLGHRSQRYIQRYTNPPEAVAAEYVEEF